MPRPRGCRRIGSSPGCTYFKPAGVGLRRLTETVLTIDEFEALRLKDYEGMGQGECSERMHVSQPTFHRLLFSARSKIADALIKGKAIRIEKGSHGEYCVCSACGAELPKKPGLPCNEVVCPSCKKTLRR